MVAFPKLNVLPALSWLTVGLAYAGWVGANQEGSNEDFAAFLLLATLALAATHLIQGLQGLRRLLGGGLSIMVLFTALIAALGGMGGQGPFAILMIPIVIAVLVLSMRLRPAKKDSALPPAPPPVPALAPARAAPTWSSALGPRKICPNCGTVRRTMRSAVCANCGFDDAPNMPSQPPITTSGTQA